MLTVPTNDGGGAAALPATTSEEGPAAHTGTQPQRAGVDRQKAIREQRIHVRDLHRIKAVRCPSKIQRLPVRIPAPAKDNAGAGIT